MQREGASRTPSAEAACMRRWGHAATAGGSTRHTSHSRRGGHASLGWGRPFRWGNDVKTIGGVSDMSVCGGVVHLVFLGELLCVFCSYVSCRLMRTCMGVLILATRFIYLRLHMVWCTCLAGFLTTMHLETVICGNVVLHACVCL